MNKGRKEIKKERWKEKVEKEIERMIERRIFETDLKEIYSVFGVTKYACKAMHISDWTYLVCLSRIN